MAVQRGSEAYDLSLFEEKPARLVALKPSPKVQKQQKRRSRLHAFLNTVVVMAVSALVISFVGMMIYSRARITEINDSIIQKQEELKIIESETVRLTNELAARTSAEQVDGYAAENGMKKIESYQIRYISVGGGDKVEVPDSGDKSIFERIGDAVGDFFDWVTYLFK